MAWVVLIEEGVGWGDGMHWGLYRSTHLFNSRDEARAEAVRLTRDHTPEHPWTEKGRTAFRVSEDSFVVSVAGAASDHHFRLTVAEEVVPGTGEPSGDVIQEPEERSSGVVPRGNRGAGWR
ncbi:hypothetical protein [Nocardiopsis halotolerans]|uniref:hypothetical protein n=1 Tax=Nocardiopsis halotolerans TaxID=124252 RepID=UPI000376CBB7|nr:hypothetical protein [Nocardiopsis halotolerans]